jgi:type III secretion protein D
MNDRIPFELRVLSGLHRGASLPVDEQPQLIGASDDADVVLVDPGIAQRHAMLRLEAGGWSLLAMDGAVKGAQHDAAEDQHALPPGAAARIGHVWVTVSPGDAPWQDPPPEPPAGSAPPEPPAQDEEQEEEAPEEGPAVDDEPAADTHDEAPAEPAPVPVQAAGNPPRRTRMVMLPAALGVMLLAVGTYAYSSRTPAPAPAQVAVVKPAPPRPPTPEELRKAFRQRLAEVDLLRRFDMQLDDRAWTLRAALDDEETARFKRILDAFVARYKIDFPIDVRIGGPDAMLPFRVTQVVTGANASIVTDDGQRLYPGDDYRGVRLVAIDGNRLRFNGERAIEVKW